MRASAGGRGTTVLGASALACLALAPGIALANDPRGIAMTGMSVLLDLVIVVVGGVAMTAVAAENRARVAVVVAIVAAGGAVVGLAVAGAEALTPRLDPADLPVHQCVVGAGIPALFALISVGVWWDWRGKK